ncbi:Gamma-glutamyltranspeptidase 1 [Smittium culicis]|uniref:Glutathione hydrolase n=1 Tax=Smittium culicis TaxID=133412 RepID=A0A1R1XJP2_9FUNG|nr:Gamma-glutamyltranspeptidase 1 [Smittium culicis]OMJ23440.1 Gamma-glutamyltranspeptidase 1 [Smittium culicis]
MSLLNYYLSILVISAYYFCVEGSSTLNVDLKLKYRKNQDQKIIQNSKIFKKSVNDNLESSEYKNQTRIKKFSNLNYNIKEKYLVDSAQTFGTNGAVATDEPTCSDIGIDVLRDGGSAIDAAIASAICIGLLNAHSSGIGGGGFMVIRTANGHSEMIDFRETAPSAATENMYEKNNTLAKYTGLSSGVPGELRGFQLAHKRYGRLSWKRLFEPTIILAKNGYKIGKDLGKALSIREKRLKRDPGLKRAYFKPNGEIMKYNDVGKRESFARTLQQIAEFGPDSFYKGDIAESMVKCIQDNGGILSLNDFSNYEPILRPTSVINYKDRKIITSSSPGSGPVLSTFFNILEGYNMENRNNKNVSIHRMLEAFKFGFSLRSHLADPEYINVTDTISKSQSKDFAAKLRTKISDNKTHSYQYYDLDNDIKTDHITTHLSVIDKDGLAVSLTSTINLYFGSSVMDPITGVIFNNEMDDFSIPGIKNAFGLPQSKENNIAPGKRPLSSMSPTIIEKDGHVEFILGASGGTRILTATTQVLLNMLEYGKSLKEAIDMPRIHDQLIPEIIEFEPGYPKSILESLFYRKHNTAQNNYYLSAIQAIHVQKDGILCAVSDGRKGGVPRAY